MNLKIGNTDLTDSDLNSGAFETGTIMSYVYFILRCKLLCHNFDFFIVFL